jgi:hypothetical protein
MVVVASETIIAEDTYTLWQDDTELATGFSGPMEMFHPGMGPGGERPPMPEGMIPPEKPKK